MHGSWLRAVAIARLRGFEGADDVMQDVAIARDFKPMPKDETDALLARVRTVASDGRFEWSKSTQAYDGPYHRKQHGSAE